MGMFSTKSLELLHHEAFGSGEKGLKRSLGAFDLICLGVGVVVGAGIFVTAGLAAAGSENYLGAGPAVTLSFVLVAVVCMLTALCYAELASMIPVSGSVYAYCYATMGELAAFMIGWDLVLEYVLGSTGVAISWKGYFVSLLGACGINLPQWLTVPTQSATAEICAAAPHLLGMPIVFNLPSVILVGLLTWLLIYGVKESSRVNNIMVFLKLLIIFFVVAVGAMYVNPENWTPYMPNGWAGVQAGAALIFFAYIGFDCLSTVAEETENPERNVPIGLIGSLIVCTILYILVGAVLTGMLPYTQLGNDKPMVAAFEVLGMGWAVMLVSVGALICMTAVLLVLLMGQPRIFFSMSRDGLLPKWLSRVHEKYRTPHYATIAVSLIVALCAGLLNIEPVIGLCNLGTIFAFALVCIGVIVLRYTRPDAKRPFKVPFFPVLPILGVLSCIYLLLPMPATTWLQFAVWLVLGAVIYLCYGRHNSLLQAHEAECQASTALAASKQAEAETITETENKQ